MKNPNNISKTEIDLILCTRYIHGYSEYDQQYNKLIKNLVKILSSKEKLSDIFDHIPPIVGEFNCITKKIYEDLIEQLFKYKFRKYPSKDIIYMIINQLPI